MQHRTGAICLYLVLRLLPCRPDHAASSKDVTHSLGLPRLLGQFRLPVLVPTQHRRSLGQAGARCRVNVPASLPQYRLHPTRAASQLPAPLGSVPKSPHTLVLLISSLPPSMVSTARALLVLLPCFGRYSQSEWTVVNKKHADLRNVGKRRRVSDRECIYSVQVS